MLQVNSMLTMLICFCYMTWTCQLYVTSVRRSGSLTNIAHLYVSIYPLYSLYLDTQGHFCFLVVFILKACHSTQSLIPKFEQNSSSSFHINKREGITLPTEDCVICGHGNYMPHFCWNLATFLFIKWHIHGGYVHSVYVYGIQIAIASWS